MIHLDLFFIIINKLELYSLLSLLEINIFLKHKDIKNIIINQINNIIYMKNIDIKIILLNNDYKKIIILDKFLYMKSKNKLLLNMIDNIEIINDTKIFDFLCKLIHNVDRDFYFYWSSIMPKYHIFMNKIAQTNHQYFLK